MAEYIECETVRNLLLGFHKPYGVGDVMWINIAEDIVDELGKIPTADVRPERHGVWLVSGDCYECSECGGGSVVNTNPYCWKCGAKMDGKDGESDG